MVNVIGVAEQGLTWGWLCWPGMRATAKNAAGRGCVPPATEQGYVRLACEPGSHNAHGAAGGVRRDAMRTP